MKQVWLRRSSGMWTDSHSAAKSMSIWIFPLIWPGSRPSWKRQFFGLYRNALRIFIDIPEARSRRFAFFILKVTLLLRWKTKATAYRSTNARKCYLVVRLAWELGE